MIEFYKVNGAGNDFIIIDDRERKLLRSIKDIGKFAANICLRRFSIGADGLIFIYNDRDENVDFRWEFYNSDGSEAEMCGNGSRCVARIAYELGIAGKKLSFRTKAGIIRAEILEKDRVKVYMTCPLDLNSSLTPDGMTEGGYVNTGVPHMVYQVDDVKNCDLTNIGSKTRRHKLFGPKGTNVDFIELIDEHNLKMRTYERGVEGETLACGTGATASALIAYVRGIAKPPITVTTVAGKNLIINFEYAGNQFSNISMEGQAQVSYIGHMKPDAYTEL